MLKNVIAPIQAWLLSQHKCVGCGNNLDLAKDKKSKKIGQIVTCSCRRVYVYNPQNKTYRRALISEI